MGQAIRLPRIVGLFFFFCWLLLLADASQFDAKYREGLSALGRNDIAVACVAADVSSAGSTFDCQGTHGANRYSD